MFQLNYQASGLRFVAGVVDVFPSLCWSLVCAYQSFDLDALVEHEFICLLISSWCMSYSYFCY
uniref:Uncharacterized protein n=1 Tax=Arundo donax TaxID=35708 RepID=A0A0A9DHT4_ARUDO